MQPNGIPIYIDYGVLGISEERRPSTQEQKMSSGIGSVPGPKNREITRRQVCTTDLISSNIFLFFKCKKTRLKIIFVLKR